MLQGILIVVAFLVVAALMMTKKIPTLLALPLMAVVICIIAGVPMFGKNADGAEIGWLTTVFEAGTVQLHHGNHFWCMAGSADEQDRRHREHHQKER